MSIPFYSNINLNNNTLENIKTPVNDTDGVNKQYVDTQIQTSATNVKQELNNNIDSKVSDLRESINAVDEKTNNISTNIDTSIKATIVDNLETLAADKSLSANQGYILANRIKEISSQMAISTLSYWDGNNNTDNPSNLVLWQSILNNASGSGALVCTAKDKIFGYFIIDGAYVYTILNETFSGTITLNGSIVNIDVITDTTGSYIKKENISIDLTIENGILTEISNLNIITKTYGKFLPINTPEITYTPTIDSDPATKKYVDNLIAELRTTIDEIKGNT